MSKHNKRFASPKIKRAGNQNTEIAQEFGGNVQANSPIQDNPEGDSITEKLMNQVYAQSSERFE